MKCGVTWWRSGYRASDFLIPTNRSQVQVPASLLHVMTLGKLFTHMCLCSPSSINWYRPQGSDALWLGIGLASHWPCVTDSSIYPPVQVYGLGKVESTPPTLQWSTAPLPGHESRLIQRYVNASSLLECWIN